MAEKQAVFHVPSIQKKKFEKYEKK